MSRGGGIMVRRVGGGMERFCGKAEPDSAWNLFMEACRVDESPSRRSGWEGRVDLNFYFFFKVSGL